MLLDLLRTQKASPAANAPAKHSRSTDLTIYEVCELLDDDKNGTGIFRLARKSLEADLPFVTYCDHAHRTVAEAAACTFFLSGGSGHAAAEDAMGEEAGPEPLFAAQG